MKTEENEEKVIDAVNDQLSGLFSSEMMHSMPSKPPRPVKPLSPIRPRRRLKSSGKRGYRSFIETTQTDDLELKILDEKKVQFFDSHKPLLKEGEYTLSAWQEVTKEEDKKFKEATTKISQHFLVSGPRYRITAEDVNAVFPPENSDGNHAYCLPHVAFNRTTLPWEIPMSKNNPWLCLVVFDEEEAPEIMEQKLKDLNITVSESFDKEKKVHTITVPPNLIPDDNTLLCHSRIKDKTELAFTIGHRLPQENGRSTVHLISLKDPLGNNQYISLYHWSFECNETRPSFKGLLGNSNRQAFHLPADSMNRYYTKGYVPLPNFLRNGEQTLSLYRGPLLPFPSNKSQIRNTAENIKPTSVSERVTFKKDVAMADVSYATAFQIGQLLTVANKKVANILFSWKRSIYQKEKQLNLLNDEEKDFFITKQREQIPPEVNEWINSLLTLETVPFNYLVPYEEILPENSVRFFELDKVWLKHCLEGALSIGKEYFNFKNIDGWLKGSYTGVLIRNTVVADYPEMIIKAYTNSTYKVEAKLHFKRKLAKDILFCCFGQKIKAIDLFLPTAAIHFGFEKNAKQGTISKKLRGTENKVKRINLNDTMLSKASRCLNLFELQQQMSVESSAEFAFQMVEGSPKVRFKL